MKRQAIVIGLGQFGTSVARALTERGVEVLAVDVREERVRVAAAFAAEAASFDATDTEALARTSPERREVCICAIGDESKESSIICTALLRQMGAQRVIARANDDLHARILKLVGAHQIVNPEREFGERFASTILHDRIIGELPLGADLLITELKPPAAFVGQGLRGLDLARRFGVTVVAIRRAGEGAVLSPDPDDPIRDSDVLIVVSRSGAVSQLMERI
ncbi:MAG: TrkA family potassium uptake protein [Candidatus Eisenbacteria bacterium]|uniref:TrkA family potassium uptake protein n=1 Tax=Eiseniibacteriota bacterium TaxID=2212470 RepID=A0A956RN48_UNCEI|nr:TrkA family potassium uptake protein [Candidatus Eisenbacteria bacterium]